MCPTDGPAPQEHRIWLLGFTAVRSADLRSPAASGDKSFGNRLVLTSVPLLGSQIVKVGSSWTYSSAPSSLWKLPFGDLFSLCPILAIHKSCECLWDISWSPCSCLLCPQVWPQCPHRAVSFWVRLDKKHKSLQCSLGVTGIAVIALWSCSPGRLCKSFTQISMVLWCQLLGTQGTHCDWHSLAVIPQQCEQFMLTFAKLGQSHYHGPRQVLSSCWPPQEHSSGSLR